MPCSSPFVIACLPLAGRGEENLSCSTWNDIVNLKLLVFLIKMEVSLLVSTSLLYGQDESKYVRIMVWKK